MTIKFNEATKRDWETVKETSRDFLKGFTEWRHLVLYIVSAFILAAIIAAPWLSDNSEWAWK